MIPDRHHAVARAQPNLVGEAGVGRGAQHVRSVLVAHAQDADRDHHQKRGDQIRQWTGHGDQDAAGPGMREILLAPLGHAAVFARGIAGHLHVAAERNP